jgi:cation:H+ antiporter
VAFFIFSGMTPYFIFLICAGVIIYCGIRLSKYGDIIAEKSGMGKAWFGLIMMASVTSLPELIAGISSVTFIDAPDLAIGDVVGSCMFNILILSILDFFYKGGAISSKVQQGQVLGAGFGVIITSLVLAAFIFHQHLPVIGWVAFPSLLFMAVYLMAVRTIYSYEKKRMAASEGPSHVANDEVPLNTAIKYYLLNALFVVGAAIFLPYAGEHIAASSGLGQTFVGTLLIAASTSLPELVVSISALRIGAVDIAVGNLFGSNLFNIFILALDDIAYTKGSLLAVASKGNIISLIAVLIMTGIAVIGFTFQQQNKRWKMAVDSMAILFVYIVTVIALYYTRNL